ncbi:unnamed protein product [Onchocerca flexuosa]|uniref:Dolichol phosphate-mannose biosynthesis regulatory protein n=1 Tax=Onchocerca flexuosa TaxID=387005 RepID=A0A183I263_9BILA|nr:unnamed protein product [Onchocerca flexuosa]
MVATDICAGYFLLALSAVIFPYLIVWIYVMPFTSQDFVIRMAFPSQYLALLFPNVCFISMLCCVASIWDLTRPRGYRQNSCLILGFYGLIWGCPRGRGIWFCVLDVDSAFPEPFLSTMNLDDEHEVCHQRIKFTYRNIFPVDFRIIETLTPFRKHFTRRREVAFRVLTCFVTRISSSLYAERIKVSQKDCMILCVAQKVQDFQYVGRSNSIIDIVLSARALITERAA